MAFNSTNAVVVGAATKKDHYDRVFDNTLLLKTSISNDGIDWTGRIRTTNADPHGIGVAHHLARQVTIGGTFVPNDSAAAAALALTGTINAAVNVAAYSFLVAPTIVEAASGTHSRFASAAFFAPTITAGAAALTDAATVYIADAPTGATNNYALLIAAGNVRLLGASALMELAGGTAPELLFSGGDGRIQSNHSLIFGIDRDNDAGNQTFLWQINNATSIMSLDEDAILTINQQAGDGDIVRFSSTDVAHGMTSLAPTAVYGTIHKASSADGGTRINGFTETKAGLQLFGYGVTDETGARTSSSRAYVEIEARKKSGTGDTDVGADANLLAVGFGVGNHMFFLDADGDSHQNVGTAWTNFDTHDDAALLHSIGWHLTANRKADPIRGRFGKLLTYNRAALSRARLVSFNRDGRHFINWSRFQMVLAGAAVQQQLRLNDHEATISALAARVEALEKAA